jgi:uncharacterized membrane protein (GlpM family)
MHVMTTDMAHVDAVNTITHCNAQIVLTARVIASSRQVPTQAGGRISPLFAALSNTHMALLSGMLPVFVTLFCLTHVVAAGRVPDNFTPTHSLGAAELSDGATLPVVLWHGESRALCDVNRMHDSSIILAVHHHEQPYSCLSTTCSAACITSSAVLHLSQAWVTAAAAWAASAALLS